MGYSRILVAQGPQQLLLGIAALRQRSEVLVGQGPGRGETQEMTEDHLVLGDFWAPEKAASLDEACRLIATQHQFRSITSVHDLDAARYGQTLSFPDYVAKLIPRLPADRADELLLTRNTQTLNEAMLHLYRNARRITLGDGIGISDNNTLRFSTPQLPGGFVQVDEIFSILPVEAEPGALAGLPVHFIEPKRYVDAVWAAAEILGSARLPAPPLPPPLTLFVMVPLTEAGWIPEVSGEHTFNLECALRHVSPDQSVWIKGHPRQQHNQAAHLARELQARGYRAYASEDVDSLPVECLASLLPVAKLIAPVSSCCITWRIVQKDTELILGAPRELVETHFPKPGFFPVNVGVRYLQTLLAGRNQFRALSRSALTEFFEQGNRWEARIATGGLEDASTDAAFVAEAIRISDEALSVPPPADRTRARAPIDTFEPLVEKLLAADLPLKARGTLLDLGLRIRHNAAEESAQMKAKTIKLREKADRLDQQWLAVQSSLSWKIIRPFWRWEQSLRRRSATTGKSAP